MLNTANAVIRKLRRSGAWTGSAAPAHSVRVVFDNAKSRQTVSFSGPVTLVTFGSEQYVWINDGRNSRADPDNPPATSTIRGDTGSVFSPPKASITVRCCKIAALKSYDQLR
jgi:hypothetical protein